MDFGLTGKVAVVVASSKGLGRAAAEELVREGARVVICARGAEALEEARAAISAAGGDVVAVPVDTARSEDLEKLVVAAETHFGSVDILVTNGGGPSPGTFDQVDDEAWAAAVAGTLSSVVRLCRRVLPGMREKGWGRIINITSIVGLTGNPGQANYAASKAGMIGMAKSLAQEVASRGITVNCVAPGFIETPMTAALSDAQREKLIQAIPSKRLGSAADVAACAVFLAGTEAAYVTGQTLHVNGGMAMF